MHCFVQKLLFVVAGWIILCVDLYASISISESEPFTLDTRFYGNLGVSDSLATFTLDTRFGRNSIRRNDSHLFILDTRFTSSRALVISDTFTVNTRSVSSPMIQLSGFVRDTHGTPLAADIFALRDGITRAVAQSRGDGRYNLALPTGTYELLAFKAGWLREELKITLHDSITESLNLFLEPMPPLPEIRVSNREYEEGQVPVIQPISSQLNVFVSSENGFRFGVPSDPSKMTIVMTHGWIPEGPESPYGIDGWPTLMARAFFDSGGSNVANLVAWQWHSEAEDCLFWAAGRTRNQGTALGNALIQALGSEYEKPIHFIGHSLGTLVNAVAANYIHGDSKEKPTRPLKPFRTHLTLFDDAELTENNLYTYILGIADLRIDCTLGRSQDFTPIPHRFHWIDNYITAVGQLRHRPNLVNVLLTSGRLGYSYDTVPELVDALIDYHGDAQKWYQSTIEDPTSSAMGNANSFERDGFGVRFGQSSAYFVQVGDGATVSEISRDEAEKISSSRVAVYTLIIDDGKARYLADFANGAIEKVGDVGVWWVETLNRSFDRGEESIARWSLRLRLGGKRGQIEMNKRTTNATESIPTSLSSYLWIPVLIPTEATFMSFDFSFDGVSRDHNLVCGINGINVSSIESLLFSDKEKFNSGQINISEWSGQSTDLFFGLLGDDSHNGTVTVDNIQFFSSASRSRLEVFKTEGRIRISWPISPSEYTLETATIFNPMMWEAVSGTPTVDDFRFTVQQSIDSGTTRFYRLRKN